MAIVYLSLGSNLGNRYTNLQKTLDLIKQENTLIKTSSLFETTAINCKEPLSFLNMVVKIETTKSPLHLLRSLQKIELELKRKRIYVNAPRTIDIDILFYDNKCIQTTLLEIPHPRLHKRLFVIEPLRELGLEIKNPLLYLTQKIAYYPAWFHKLSKNAL